MEESKTIPNTTNYTSLNISTPNRVNPNPNTFGLDPMNVVPKRLFGFGSLKKEKGSMSQKPTFNLPQKYEMLCDFFVAMVNSLRLLRLKRVPTTFTKLSSHIESLTDRRFSLHHLAQVKYILQEVIVVKKIRVVNEKTNCMQEDYLLSIDMDALEIDNNTEDGNGYSQLKKIFRSRVDDFSKTHLEDEDIPKGELPHLSHQSDQEPGSNSNTSTPLVVSIVAPSFKRRFSSKTLTSQICGSSQSPIKEASYSEINNGFSGLTNETFLGPVLTPVKLASIPIPLKCTSTPSELASTPIRLMAATPAIRTPKRPLMTRDDDDNCELTANKSTKRRSLKFDERNVDIKDELGQVDEKEDIFSSQSSIIVKDDVLAVLPENVLQSLIEKEKKMKEEKDPILSQARRRQQMMAGVPKLFDMIRLLFQSIKRTVITKDELIHKLLSGHLDITDRVEVEEQVKLLQELAPEYISERISLSGDTLISLNKYSSTDSIEAKLLEAN